MAVGDRSKPSGYFAIYRNNLVSRTRDAARPGLGLFPNPARAHATLDVPAAPQARPVEITDALGRLVSHSVLPANAPAAGIDLRGLMPGVYTVRCGGATTRLVIE